MYCTPSDTEKDTAKGATEWVTPGPDGAVDLRSPSYLNRPLRTELVPKAKSTF